MNYANINCLFHCATAITDCNIISINQFKDFSLYYKIINISSNKCEFVDLVQILSDFFNGKLPNIFHNKDDDDTLLKMLMLAIVVYILKSNDGNKKAILMELCDKIPRDLHPNACAMFAPIIMRHSDGDDITVEDLDKCLNDNDKENQMMYFSPIKTKDRQFCPEQRNITTQKQKIHQSIKACRTFELFPLFYEDFENDNEAGDTSTLVKLVNYVQSPDYQTKKLMKCNRDLGKNVNELEHQLFMSSTFENELDKTLNRWKEKCKTLENKLKQARYTMNGKDEEILEKNLKIEQLSGLEGNNKRLEEKIKDYQLKLSDMQLINAQLDATSEENTKLKTENHNLSHYYSLAKQRRIELENLTKDLENQKIMNFELVATRERLTKTESQLVELQNYLNNLTGNHSHETLSETSFNNSFYIPETMSYVVEKERDELIIELTRIGENTVDKIVHETMVHDLNIQLSFANEQLTDLNQRLTIMTTEESDVRLFCEYAKEDKNWDATSTGMVTEVRELFEKNMLEIIKLKQCLVQIKTEKEDLVVSKVVKEELILSLGGELEEVRVRLRELELGCKDIVDSLDGREEDSSKDLVTIIKERLKDNESRLSSYKLQIHACQKKVNIFNEMVPNVCHNLYLLKDDVQRMRDDNSVLINDMMTEISLFKDHLTDGDMVTGFSQPWLESLYLSFRACVASSQSYEDLNRNFEASSAEVLSLKKANEDILLTKTSLENELERCVTDCEKKIIGFKKNMDKRHKKDIEQLTIRLEQNFDEMKKDLIEKHLADENEMKFDMEKLINDYQDCLNQLNNLGLEHEETMNDKDNLIAVEITKCNDSNQRILELEAEVSELQKSINKNNVDFLVTNEELASQQKLLENSYATCQLHENNIKEHKTRIEELRHNEDILNAYLVQSETEQKQIKEELCRKELELMALGSKLSEKRDQLTKLMLENESMKNEIIELKNKATSDQKEMLIKDGKIVSLDGDLDCAVKARDSFKLKYSKINLENEKLSTEIAEKNTDYTRMMQDKRNEIDMLQFQVSTTEEDLKSMSLSLKENLNKVSIFESEAFVKDNKIHDLQACVESYNSQISSLSSLLMAKNNESVVYEKESQQQKSRIVQLELANVNDRQRIAEMNELIEELEEASRTKSIRLTDACSEISAYKDSVKEWQERNVTLQSKFDDLLKEVDRKEDDIVTAKASVSNFMNKIQSLESIIDTEMRNYEKVNNDFRHVEEESIHYLNKYNDLVKENREELNNYQETITQLTERLHKIEEERDDQIHGMEKSFNTKIFELQQIAEDSVSELLCLKNESIESRKSNKSMRLQLESEVDRLQKALQSRESQYQDEKTALKSVIEKEREEKGKYKDNYEREMNQIENQMKCAEEKSARELKESHCSVSILEAKVNEQQVTNYKLTEELKGKESQYKKEIRSLENRVTELEPLEQEIKQLEEMTRRLITKVTDLEGSENMKELQLLRQKNKSLTEYVTSLEEREEQLVMEKTKMDQQMAVLRDDCEDLTKIRTDLTESINTAKDQLQNAESRLQSRRIEMDNYVKQLKSLTCDNEALKKRYLMLRDTNEEHKIEVERDHQGAIDSYIARIQTLTNDIASFQDQIQLLTEEKNLLVSKDYSSKRTIDEQSSKLNGLQKLIWNHTENERRQMSTTYDENSRFTRMSHWNEKPQLMRQLPPVSRIDKQIIDSMGLNASSRMRFESFVCSPYQCEDESSLYMSKELPLAAHDNAPIVPSRRTHTHQNTVTDVLSQISTPLKKQKKKDGIRLQLSNRIRKSLNLEQETPKSRKHYYPETEQCGVPPTVSNTTAASIKSEISMASSKPPIPKKGFFGALRSQRKSSQLNVIDIDQLRRKEKNKAECGETQFVNVTPLPPSAGPSTSVYSLFTQDGGSSHSTESKAIVTRSHTRDTNDHFTQSAKTPKPNSVIRSLIRRSKNMTPKRRHDSIDSL